MTVILMGKMMVKVKMLQINEKVGQQGCNTNTNNNKQELALSEENKSKKEKINIIRRMTIKTRTKTTKKGNQQ